MARDDDAPPKSGSRAAWPARALSGSSSDDTGVDVVGAQSHPFRDAYHFFLRISWWAALGVIVAAFLLANLAFAAAFYVVGGVSHMARGSFADAYYFSVQTLATIGYGTMAPESTGAHLLVIAEAVCGLILTAISTGLVFAKFSRSTARMVFSERVVIAPWDGVPTLMFRVGNERGNQIFEAQLRLVLTRTEKTTEGVTFYRLVDLPPVRERSPAFARSWTVMHRITPDSPLHGETPESLARNEVELLVSVSGTDDTSMQLVHARKRYTDEMILWGARLADVLTETPEGRLVLDVRRFHDVVATEPTEAFPYPRR